MKYEEALRLSTEYFHGEELPAKVFVDKYALRDSSDEIVEGTPDDMHRRLAKEFARIESGKFKKPLGEQEIYGWLKNYGAIIPQGSPMFGIGNPYKTVSLSNCFVLTTPIDSYNSILDTDKELVNISKRRGGVGIDLSNLRPAGDPTNNAAKTSTGIPSWMERYSHSIREVGQCLHGDSLILTKNGLKKIKEVSCGEMVWTKIGWVKNLATKNNGIKKLFKITTKMGFSVIASEDHIFQTFDFDGNLGEKRLSDFNTNDNIVLCLGNGSDNTKYIQLEKSQYQNTNNKPNNCQLPNYLDEKLAYILGYSYGDGYVIQNKYGDKGLELACSNDYPKIKEKLESYIYEVFKYSAKYSSGDGNLEIIGIHNKCIVEFLRNNGLLKQKANSLVFPELILRSSEKVQAAFLSGYFDADGDICGRKSGYRFRSVCLDWIKVIQIILSSVGVASKIFCEKRENRGWKDIYTLSIIGQTSQKRFVSCFAESYKVQNSKFISKRDLWTTPFKAKSFNIKYNKFNYCPGDSYLSLTCATKLKDHKNNVINTLLQDKIKDIVEHSVDESYDLVLEDEHLFWCNGMYVHNSARRGALLMSISVHHPDIEKFISIKDDETKVTGANVSVRLTEEFLQAVQKDGEVELRFPVNSQNVYRKIPAKDLWKKIIHYAWKRAEPGLLFWDNILKESLPDCYKEEGFETRSTNPCSEIALSELDSCRLLAINLMSCVENKFTENASFDYKKFYEIAQVSQRLMDDLIDLELECVEKIIKKIENDPEDEEIKRPELKLWYKIAHYCKQGRRTGLGITALGDVLASLGIKYGSEKSIKIVERIYRTLKFGAYRSSIDMAKELGAFPIFQKKNEKDNPYLKRFEDEVCVLVDQKDSSDYIDAVSGADLISDMKKYGRRNIALLTTAPTGSLSTQAGYFIGNKFYSNTSSGIEPIFKTSYIRRKKGNPGDQNFRSDFIDKVGDHWMEFPVYHSGVKAWMEVNGKKSPDGNPYEGSCAEEINWVNRVKLQAAAQKHVDHSISSTINLPADISEEEVAKIYESAWKAGCKGITIYRAGCRSGVLIEKKEEQEVDRPKELDCQVYHTQVNGSPYFVLVGLMSGAPYEVFAGKNGFLDKDIKTGKIVKSKKRHYKAIFDDDTELSPITACCSEHEETITRLTSALLRAGADMLLIVQQLERVGGGLHSFAKGIARVLKKFIPDGTKEKGEICPECRQEAIIRKEGCLSCESCGYSKC